MTEKTGDSILRYWPLIVMLCGGLVAWGTVTQQVANVQDGNKTMAQDNKAILAKLDRQAETLSSIRADIAGMQASSLAAGGVVADLQTRVRSLEARR